MTTTAKGLFGLKIPAGGAIIPLDIPWDVRITNIAFGEEVKGAARSVIKVHRASLPDYSDDELDEFDDDEDDEDELDEDEEEEDEDEEDAADVEEASKAVNGKKSSKKTVEEMGEEGDDDEDDEDEEDDEDSEDDDEDEQWVEEDFVICSLYPKQNEQAVVDLAFCVDEEIGFSVSGENDVELTGYYVAPDPLDVGSDSEYDEFDEYDEDGEDDFDSDDLEALYGEVEDDEDEESDDEMDDDVQIEELDAEAKALPAVAKLSKAANSKKRSNEEVEEADEAVADAAGAAVSQLTKNQRKKLNKKLKTDADANTSVDKVEVASKDAKDGKTNVKTAEKEVVKKDGKAASKKVTLPSGLIIEDKVVGKGAQAKAGNRVGMRYVGRLTNGKQFDANTSGKPFAFKLGKGEVIAAWDEGIKGMQVGGQRRLTCPPKLAYGKAGAPPDIPSNSTLVFDVKLLEIK